ncbi:hypothetical protein BBP00_00009710 [Phytophthora kernoviae]|uniref:Uncharacterized protein n=1 Tax=Phytophthora kernoviae TaxID=325452 RepID=A0A3F2RBU3_9STRA|nr:hypothetical protein BBP00_00009710 [Phytophthora kernoviae]
MPLLLRPTAPSPSIDELAFAVSVAPLSTATFSVRSVSSVTDSSQQLQRCATHGRLSYRRRFSTAGTEADLEKCTDEMCNDPHHIHLQQRASQQSLPRSNQGKTKDPSDAELDSAFRDSKHSSRETQPDDDMRSSSDASYMSEAERVSSVLSCGCSCADANEMCITSSAVVIEDRQLAVVDKELRDFRKTFMRKIYTRLTKIPGPFGRKKAKTTCQRPINIYERIELSRTVFLSYQPMLTVNKFPPNVGLTTMQELSKQCLMVRLSHLYAVDEHATLSQPATVDFSKLFTVKNAVALPVKGTSVVLQAIEVRAYRLYFGKSFDDADVESWDDEDGDSIGDALLDLVETIAFE